MIFLMFSTPELKIYEKSTERFLLFPHYYVSCYTKRKGWLIEILVWIFLNKFFNWLKEFVIDTAKEFSRLKEFVYSRPHEDLVTPTFFSQCNKTRQHLYKGNVKFSRSFRHPLSLLTRVQVSRVHGAPLRARYRRTAYRRVSHCPQSWRAQDALRISLNTKIYRAIARNGKIAKIVRHHLLLITRGFSISLFVLGER